MSDFTQRLKEQADLGRIIGEIVALKPGGNGFIGLCPFHGEKTPSFHVHTARRFFYCFGCHAHGDVFAFFVQLKKLSFPEAVEEVAARCGVEVPRAATAQESDPLRRELLAINAAAAEFFSKALEGREGAGARAYLESREVGAAAWRRFELGYAPANGRGLVTHLQSRDFMPALALRAGLCQWRRDGDRDPSPGSEAGAAWTDLYDRFRSRLIFPIADERGAPIAFGGRLLESEVSGERQPPKYLNSPESPLYTKSRVVYNLHRARPGMRELGYAILVEGYFDCLRVAEAGFTNVVASCGTALTAQQVGTLQRNAKRIVVNFDPDTAGAAAAERSIGLLLEAGVDMRMVSLEGGLDPDLFVRRHGASAYGTALQTSQPFFPFLAERARRQFDLHRGEGKLGAVNFLLPYLSHVQDSILRQSYAEELAASLGIDQALISRQLIGAARQRRAQLAPTAAVEQPELLHAERIILRALVEGSDSGALADSVREQRLFEDLAGSTLFKAMTDASSVLDWQTWSEHLEPSDRLLLAEILMGPSGREASAADRLTPDTIAAALEALRRRSSERGAQRLRQDILAAERRGDKPTVAKLSAELLAVERDRLRSRAAAGGRRG